MSWQPNSHSQNYVNIIRSSLINIYKIQSLVLEYISLGNFPQTLLAFIWTPHFLNHLIRGFLATKWESRVFKVQSYSCFSLSFVSNYVVNWSPRVACRLIGTINAFNFVMVIMLHLISCHSFHPILLQWFHIPCYSIALHVFAHHRSTFKSCVTYICISS